MAFSIISVSILAIAWANRSPSFIHIYVVIQCAGVDTLRDDSFAYADALKAVGVDVKTHCYKGVPHCFPSVIITHPQAPVFYERYNAFLIQHASSSTPRD